jgi:hypothetical protein
LKSFKRHIITFCLLFASAAIFAQLSPGDLSAPHAHLEGLSNCTQCHVLGNKISADKCLSCHTEIKERTDGQKGYHSSSEVKGKLCFSCHSEHNGKNFQLVRFDITKFDHNLTGYPLSVPHAKKECKDCHNQKNITDQKIRAKKYTWLGLQTACLTCHTDYHQQTLSPNCLNCHTEASFIPASKFSHSTAKFQLKGKHTSVDCFKCHRVETVNGKKFQEFRGIQFASCTNCHKDPHQNKFGQACLKCHTEETFHSIKNTAGFDHNKTAFKLEDKHLQVECNKCHKTKYTDPLKHDRCTDCHTDYHKGQFTKNSLLPDCKQCHSTKGFASFSYTIEQHNKSVFQLKGSHLAVPCSDCHRKLENWSFRQIGIDCKDCHKDIHQRIIEPKYYPGADCRICHNENRWSDVTFNHSLTSFSLTGAHSKQSCRSCHFRPDSKGVVIQKFYELSTECTSCHKDNHFNQFSVAGKTDCTKCHGTDNWKASKFNHNSTAFKLDGKHINVPCYKCHKPQQEGSFRYVKYKIKEFTCEACHFSS